MKNILFTLFTLLLANLANGQSVADYRGGWLADIDGARHIWYIVMRNDEVTGVYCSDCENLYDLAFIDDGRMNDDSLEFTLYHYPEKEAAWQEKITATLDSGELHLRLTDRTGQVREQVVHRQPEADKIRYPIAPYRTNLPAGNQPRELPRPAVNVTPDTVLGMWLWGTGPTKQYFFFREHKGGIRGMVCGPCFSVNDMAPLEQVSMNGTNFHFEIVHEDNGAYPEPHSNVTDAVIARNEMHMTVHPSHNPDGPAIEMNLLGPVLLD